MLLTSLCSSSKRFCPVWNVRNAFAEVGGQPKRMDERNSNKKIVTFSFNSIAESFVAENRATSFLSFVLSLFVCLITHEKKNDVNFLSDNPEEKKELMQKKLLYEFLR